MKFQPCSNPGLTWLQGYVRTTYAELVEIFGPPELYAGDKTNAEWCIRFDDDEHTVATIYDYKEDVIPKGVYDWHIGGSSSRALQRICEVLGAPSPGREF